MSALSQNWKFPIFAGLITVLQALFVYQEFYWYLLLPVGLILLVWLVSSVDKFFLFTVLVTPLSIELKESDLGLALSLPSEALIILMTVLFYFKLFVEKSVPLSFWKHPITLAVLFHIGWMLLSSFTSTMPIVSLKATATRIWFVSAFYFLGTQLFLNRKNIVRFFWMYLLPLAGIVIYATYRLAMFNFEKQPAHWVMDPFYNDHTHYGAVLAMFVPFVLGFTFFARLSSAWRTLYLILALIICGGLFFSISRAAWLSVIGASGLWIIMLLRIRWTVVLGTAATLVGLFFLFQTEIIMSLEQNKQESSGDFGQHFRSATNISSDASNLERILRWKAAVRMFNERPLMGFGPGTYAFQYAPYQRSNELTIISTNFGSLGSAHSEYLLPLSEQGLPGMLSFILLGIVFIWVGCRVIFWPGADRLSQVLAYAALLGLATYFIHAFLNNFLDTDEASVPFWGMAAALTALDLNRTQATPKKSSHERAAQESL